MRYRKKPVVIEATQWFKNGDHPKDNCCPISPTNPDLSEGEVVRYFRHPDVSGKTICSKCNKTMHEHGWIDTLEDGHNVCPGDWIITGVKGEFYPCKPDIFEQTYEPADTKTKDDIFIQHIQSHLKEGEFVICKICGKKAEDIIKAQEEKDV